MIMGLSIERKFKIYIKKNEKNELYADLIDAENKILNRSIGANEIYSYINHCMYLSGKKKYISDFFEITVSDEIQKKHPKLINDLKKNCEESENFKLNISYSKKNINKKLIHQLALFTIVTVVSVGAYVTKVNLNKETSTELDEEPNIELEFPEVVIDENLDLISPNEKIVLPEEVIQKDDILVIDELNELIGSGLNATDKDYVSYFLNTEEGKKIKLACKTYNVDLASVLAIGLNEFSLNLDNLYREDENGEKYYDPFQIDSMEGKFFQLENVLTQEMDTITMDYESVTNPETHYNVAVAYIKKLMNQYNNNPNLYPAAYNMGEGVTDLVISKIMDVNNMSFEEVINSTDTELFTDQYDYIYSNPSSYFTTCSKEVQEKNISTLNYLSEWNYDTYGNGKYNLNFFKNYNIEFTNENVIKLSH